MNTLSIQKKPIFAVSDLHMGDGGSRDNFAYGGREKQFLSFLDFVEENNGKLIICGDLFELWQANISKVLTKRISLLDRLDKMKAVYILGNHDIDLKYFIGVKQSAWLAHPFFRGMCLSYYSFNSLTKKFFRFCHGHEVDLYCADENPSLGRITAIYTGMKEDRNGSPIIDKYRTIEQRVLGRLEKLARFLRWFTCASSRSAMMNRSLLALRPPVNITVYGHTHRQGRVNNVLFNCGTWAERVNSFVYIDLKGTVSVCDWIDGQAVLNKIELPI